MNLAAIALPLAALAQPASPPPAPRAVTAPRVLAPPPATPAPPRPGTSGFVQERDSRARQLRETCISERGIRTILEGEEQSRAAGMTGASGDWRAIEQEVGQAVYAVPLDLDRLERAVAARAAYQAAEQLRRDRATMATLRRLSPADRAIYARQFTPMMVYPMPRPCLALR